jgi:hypothetical protein
MNTAKHTPGPWYPHYAKADHCLSSSVWGQEPGNQVAVIGGKSLQTMNANAALIAAAPAMYEALVETMRVLRSLRDNKEEWYTLVTPELLTAWDKNKAALAQAEGHQHG